MATEKQVEANRRNAARSTGPITEMGKAQARLNALKHGLRSMILDILPHEDPAEFADRVEAWFKVHAPRNEEEARLVHQAATLSWKLDRAVLYEQAQLGDRVKQSVSVPLKEDASQGNAEHRILMSARIASFNESIEGERIRRYMFALNRELNQTLEHLAKLREREARASRQAPPVDTQSSTEPQTRTSVPTEPRPAPAPPRENPVRQDASYSRLASSVVAHFTNEPNSARANVAAGPKTAVKKLKGAALLDEFCNSRDRISCEKR